MRQPTSQPMQRYRIFLGGKLIGSYASFQGLIDHLRDIYGIQTVEEAQSAGILVTIPGGRRCAS